ncbi:MAG TPA: hypothetical protein PLW65_21400 [Pseudomonadota bacterium]|nr:hypothetical protein [Pseudomonadota bacterium]
MSNRFSSCLKGALVAAGVCLGTSHLACAPTRANLQPEVTPARPAEEQEHSELAVLGDRVRVLEESLPLLACGPELRALIRDARQLCSSKPAAGVSAARVSTECNEKDMKVALVTAEKDLETKSIGQKLLSVLRHEVVYPRADGKIATKREDRLKALARERLLPSTRFLMIAGGGDATQRIDAVRARLMDYGIKDTETVMDGDKENTVQRFEKPWNLRLRVPLQQLPLVDRPVPPAEARDVERAVFVFRTDCL